MVLIPVLCPHCRSDQVIKGGMRQHEVVINQEQRQLLAQSVFTFTQRGTPPPNRGHMLTQAEIEPLDKGCVDLPTAGG